MKKNCKYKDCEEKARVRSKWCHDHRLRRFWVWEAHEDPMDAMKITARTCADAARFFVESMGVPHHDGEVYIAGHDHEPLKLEVDYEAGSNGHWVAG